MCLCHIFESCKNQTEVHVLQHDRERKHAFGTVRLLRICLDTLVVHRMHADSGRNFAKPEGFPLDAGVLYPGPGSRDLETLAPDERPTKLVVIDGTWSQAHRMYRDSPWLQKLPRFSLHPAEPSRYRIRKEPRHECLSTLESTAMALRMIEPETHGIDCLLQTFERMVDRQLECIAENQGGPRRMKAPRVRPMRAVPEPLWQNPETVVVVYAESALPGSRQDKQPRELAQWSAVRLSDSEQLFDSILSSNSAMPTGHFLQALGWSDDDLRGAESMSEFQLRWREFLRPTDVVVTWNRGSAQLAAQNGLGDDVYVLKESYGNTVVGNVGTLEQVIEREKLGPCTRLSIAGRAGLRLARAQLAARYLGTWAQQRLQGG